MKLLLINLPYYGHVIPTIGLVQELIRLGCEVTYLMPFGWQEIISESGAAFAGYPNHWQLSEQIKHAYSAAEAMISDFDGVLYEQFFFLGKHLAQKYGKPAARIFTAPAANSAIMNEYISSKGPMHIFRWKWVARAFTKDIAKGIPLKTDNWLDEIIENPPDLNLVYTLREFQPCEADFPEPQYKFLGPSIYTRKASPFSFQKQNRPVIYISLGTVVKGAVSFFQSCMEAFREEDMDVILSVGTAFPISKLKNVPSHVHIYPSVPQLRVLQLADVFVTHGGMNSISEAMVYGVPMVVIPFTADQPVNAKRIEALGLGKQLTYPFNDHNLLKRTVLSVLSDPHIRKNFEQIQAYIHDAPGNTGGAGALIEYYQKHLCSC